MEESNKTWDLQDLKIIVSLMLWQVLDTGLELKGQFLEIVELEQHQTQWVEFHRNKLWRREPRQD